MSKTYQKYKLQTEEMKDKLNILLQRYQKSYPLYKANKNITEYKLMYENDQQQIQKIFDNFFLLENEIIKSSDKNSNNLYEKNQTIQLLKKTYHNLNEENINETNESDAGKPRENDSIYKLHNEYYKLGYHILLISGISYMLKSLLYE